MTRTIRKKAFDDDLMLSDDFDESILDKIEKQIGGTGKPERAGEADSAPSLDTDEPMDAQGSFSLDDFKTPSMEKSLPAPPVTNTKESTPSSPPPGIARRIAKPKLLVMVAVSLVLVLSVAFVAARYLMALARAPRIVTMVKRPVPFPVRTEEQEFLIMARSENEKALVSLVLEMKFRGTLETDPRDRDQIVLRDAIYQFLSDEHPLENTLKYWEKIADEDLPIYLRATFPHNGLDSIKLARFTHL